MCSRSEKLAKSSKMFRQMSKRSSIILIVPSKQLLKQLLMLTCTPRKIPFNSASRGVTQHKKSQDWKVNPGIKTGFFVDFIWRKRHPPIPWRDSKWVAHTVSNRLFREEHSVRLGILSSQGVFRTESVHPPPPPRKQMLEHRMRTSDRAGIYIRG
jgi:hypothetical protein